MTGKPVSVAKISRNSSRQLAYWISTEPVSWRTFPSTSTSSGAMSEASEAPSSRNFSMWDFFLASASLLHLIRPFLLFEPIENSRSTAHGACSFPRQDAAD